MLCIVLDVGVEAVNRKEKTPCNMVLTEERTNEQSGDSDKDHDRESDRGVTQSRRRRKTSLMDTSPLALFFTFGFLRMLMEESAFSGKGKMLHSF